MIPFGLISTSDMVCPACPACFQKSDVDHRRNISYGMFVTFHLYGPSFWFDLYF